MALISVSALTLGACTLSHGSEVNPAVSSSPAASASTSSGSLEPTPSATVPAGLEKFYSQNIAWTSCRNGDQCGTLAVPLDYADPQGKTIRLAVLKVPAESTSIGVLVINPGGPGGPGVDTAPNFAQGFDLHVRESYDIVGFDPRGIGRSDPLKCESKAKVAAINASNQAPTTPAQVAADDRMTRQLGEACLARSGDIVRHMSTLEVAEDMDILRAALGQAKLNFYGASYGTYLGATYANLFPGNVGRMVLDGAVDPSLTQLQFNLGQAKGFEVALRAFVAHCTAQPGCFLGSTVDQGVKRIQRFLAEVATKPLPAGRQKLRIGNAVQGIWNGLSFPGVEWYGLTAALQSAFQGDGTALLQLAGIDSGLVVPYDAVMCLDHDDGIPSSKVGKYLPQFLKISPTWGRIYDYQTSLCANWPVHSGVVGQPLHAQGAPPIVVIGTTRDPNTPLVWAQALSSQLDSGTLITRDGDGHTAYFSGNPCVDQAVDSFLVSGTVPPPNLVCPSL